MIIERILIIGYGSIGKRHLKIARILNPNSEIWILRHNKSNEAKVPEFANGVFYNLSQALIFNPKLVVIASPASLHIESALAFSEIGANILIEKPLSISLNGIDQLINSRNSLNTKIIVGYNLRFLNSLQTFKKFIDLNLVGNIFSVRCEIGQYLPTWREGTDYKNGVSARKELGGGVLLELSHEIDYLIWIFGDISWINATISKQSNLEIDVEDTAHLIIGFTSKVNNNNLIANLNLDFIRHDTTRYCIAIGEKGTLRWNALTGIVDYFNLDLKKWSILSEHIPERDESYFTEWQHLFDCINNNTKPLVTLEDGIKVIKIVEAATKSNATQNRVNINN